MNEVIWWVGFLEHALQSTKRTYLDSWITWFLCVFENDWVRRRKTTSCKFPTSPNSDTKTEIRNLDYGSKMKEKIRVAAQEKLLNNNKVGKAGQNETAGASRVGAWNDKCFPPYYGTLKIEKKKSLKEEKSIDFSVNGGWWWVILFSCFGCSFIMLLLLLVIVNAVQILKVLIYWFLKGKMQVVEGSVLSSPSINRPLGKSIGTEANILTHVWFIRVLMKLCKGFRCYIRDELCDKI